VSYCSQPVSDIRAIAMSRYDEVVARSRSDTQSFNICPLLVESQGVETFHTRVGPCPARDSGDLSERKQSDECARHLEPDV
jgi:hypothetical protein